MLKPVVISDQLKFVDDTETNSFTNGFSLNFQRTLRIPDDGKTYPLPPGLGQFPIKRVEDYADKVPESWRKRGGVFIPMYQREALWISFNSRVWRPNALKIAIGKVNAVSGEPWDQSLKQAETPDNDARANVPKALSELMRQAVGNTTQSQKPQPDYVVCPPQPWLDGINAGDGFIKQFVAMPLGMGYTVEGQVTGKEEFGGIQIIVYEPKPGKFADEPPPTQEAKLGLSFDAMQAPPSPMAASGAEMGMGAGGKMKQKIYPDPHGIDTWDAENYGRVYVHIVNSMAYREITGEEPPKTPITAKTYAQYNYPWFDLYDEQLGDVSSPDTLKNVKSVKEMDAEKGFDPQQDDDTVNVPDDNVKKLPLNHPGEVEDGEW